LFIIVALVSRHGIAGAVRTWRQPAYKPS
jgi:hypothetical protein